MPRLGWFCDEGGTLRPLAGLAGNFVPGETHLEGVISAASSGEWTLAKTARELVVLDRSGNLAASLAVQDGPAVLGFSPGGEPAAVYLSAAGVLLLWNGERFEPAAWAPGRDEEVLAIACPAMLSVSMLIRRGAEVWRRDHAARDGAIQREWLLAGVGLPALLLPDGSITHARERLLIRRTEEGIEHRTELPGAVLHLSELGHGLLGVRTAQGAFAVQWVGAEPRVFELPGGVR